MVLATANILRVPIEAKKGILTGKTTKLFYMTGDLGIS